MGDGRERGISKELWALLPGSPDAYVQKLDFSRSLALVIRLDANAYRQASFLDDRIISQFTQGVWFPLGRVVEAVSRTDSPCGLHFIFHTGHVGSTLVSRLLDDTGFVLSLREPLPLRNLADAHDALESPTPVLSGTEFKAVLETTMRLWSRGYAWTRAAVIKATSSAGRMAIPLLESRSQSRAVCLNLPPEPYIATLLSGPNSIEDLRGHGPGRLRRLNSRCKVSPELLGELSPGQLAALGWLVETASQHDALRRFPERVMALDFDEFLGAVTSGLERILGHFGLPKDERFLAAASTNPALQRYSKAPDLPFSREDRRQLLRESRRENAAEIGMGIEWLERLARSEPSLAAIVAAAGGL